jgi:hypothetical protein
LKCLHCLVSFHAEPDEHVLGKDADGGWSVVTRLCPSCNRYIFSLRNGEIRNGQHGRSVAAHDETFVRPRASARPPCPIEVPAVLADDYRQACLVIPDSPKASAALSRRCLQHLLREHFGVKQGDLVREIQQVIDNGKLPTHLVEAIDAIRNIGNLAAHPAKSAQTGEIVDVEPGEAEWNLDVLEGLFDFCFVQPAVLKRKREELDKKLAATGKPPMK